LEQKHAFVFLFWSLFRRENDADFCPLFLFRPCAKKPRRTTRIITKK